MLFALWSLVAGVAAGRRCRVLFALRTLVAGTAAGCRCKGVLFAQWGLWLVPLQGVAGCCWRVLLSYARCRIGRRCRVPPCLSEFCLLFGACLLAPLQCAAAGCCFVCALKLGCWCRCRVPLQNAAFRCRCRAAVRVLLCALGLRCRCRVPLQGAGVGLCAR